MQNAGWYFLIVNLLINYDYSKIKVDGTIIEPMGGVGTLLLDVLIVQRTFPIEGIGY